MAGAGVGEAVSEHLVFTTDPEQGALRAIAREEGIASLRGAARGRWPLLGPDRGGAPPRCAPRASTSASCSRAPRRRLGRPKPTTCPNPAALWAALQWQAQASRAANIHVLMPYSDRLREFAEWYRQLWAESLGKRLDRGGAEVFRGPTPVAAVGATDQHSQVQLFIEGPFDKTVTFIRVRDTRELLTIPHRGPRTEDRELEDREPRGRPG